MLHVSNQRHPAELPAHHVAASAVLATTSSVCWAKTAAALGGVSSLPEGVVQYSTRDCVWVPLTNAVVCML